MIGSSNWWSSIFWLLICLDHLQWLSHNTHTDIKNSPLSGIYNINWQQIVSSQWMYELCLNHHNTYIKWTWLKELLTQERCKEVDISSKGKLSCVGIKLRFANRMWKGWHEVVIARTVGWQAGVWWVRIVVLLRHHLLQLSFFICG